MEKGTPSPLDWKTMATSGRVVARQQAPPWGRGVAGKLLSQEGNNLSTCDLIPSSSDLLELKTREWSYFSLAHGRHPCLCAEKKKCLYSRVRCVEEPQLFNININEISSELIGLSDPVIFMQHKDKGFLHGVWRNTSRSKITNTNACRGPCNKCKHVECARYDTVGAKQLVFQASITLATGHHSSKHYSGITKGLYGAKRPLLFHLFSKCFSWSFNCSSLSYNKI